MKHHHQDNQANNRLFFFFAIPFLILLVLYIFQRDIMYFSLWLISRLWFLADIPQLHDYVMGKLNLLNLAGSQINIISWSQFIFVMNHTAGILLLFMVPLTLGGIWIARNHPANLTRREINIYTLPWIMSKFSPNIIPALCYGDKKTLLLNVDPPEHKRALRPDEFAEMHQLIVDKRLNHDKARKAFEKQLGKPLKDANSFSEHEKALVAAFGSFAFLNDRKTAEQLLDNLNRSCLFKPRKAKSKRGYPETAIAMESFNKVMASKKAKAWIKQHKTTRTALSALHCQHLRLPGSRFRWLKGLDRTLWYALTSSDRSKVFVEGAGVISAMQWECLIEPMSKKLKRKVTLPDNLMGSAITGLEADLRSIGAIVEEAELGKKTASKPQEDEDQEWQILKNAPLPPQQPERQQPEKEEQKPAPSDTRAPFHL